MRILEVLQSLPADSAWITGKPEIEPPANQSGPEFLVLYRKREQARRAHEHGVFARFRYNDLKEAGRGCGGRGHYGN